MSSRGFFVGQVIDDLDAIASQVRQRCKLGQTDLNRVLEDFFKELLNLVYGINLRNLNKDRSNAPGLDLGDKAPGARVAYQITSQADAAKVNATLRKITAADAATYDRFRVLVIGERQGSYALDPKLAARRAFAKTDIVGITELCRDIMDLPLADLQAVHRKLADEQRRIVIELEPELPDGSFKTSMLQFIEAKPSIGRSDASLLFAHPDVEGLFADNTEAQTALDGFVDTLAKLPRMTREFFGWLVDEGEEPKGIGSSGLEVNADYVDAKCRAVPNFTGEIRLLTAHGFIDFGQEERHLSGRLRLHFPGSRHGNFNEAFINFRNATGLTAATVFSTMNFSPFGPSPTPDATDPGAGGASGTSSRARAVRLRSGNAGAGGTVRRQPRRGP
ncbi:SMEK domain-containing protein [Methylobacterium sp. B1]|uniref:SMEK domain-containing protein n=1 Tax=Methylobacterium sp. B1 TaxID=91459 RepID=UPI000345BF84|nr:SMEK domain-containing protein [Methylobacterium sp. B1]